MSRTEFTPDEIFRLAPNEIFVFGSNLAGCHGGGAARCAVNQFGAIWGKGVGLQGQSYAIPTMQGGVETIKPYVDDFIEFARLHPTLKFLVTPIGCGIAGFTPAQIAPLFAAGLDMANVILPQSFVDILGAGSAPEESRDERKARLVNVFKDTMSMIIEEVPLAEAVERSIAGTRFYPELANVPVNRELGKNVKVTVTDHRSFLAAQLMARRNPDKRIAVLNFASATSPGGGVKHGSSAQEESLCRCSTLYPVLNRRILHEEYYSFHYNRQDCLYTDACIYSPGIKVIKSDEKHPERLPDRMWVDVDVITCAAPNFRMVMPLPDNELRELHLKRGRRILDVALDNGADCLVLGAFGCGAFRNDPNVVASAYAQLMEEYKHAFDEVEFAIFYWGKEVANYEAFKGARG